MNENVNLREGQREGETDEEFLRREADAQKWRREQNHRLKTIRTNVEKRFGTNAHWH